MKNNFFDTIMSTIRDYTDTPEPYCQQIEASLKNNIPKAFEAFELWTIPEIKAQAQASTGHPINSEMADDISEKLYTGLEKTSVFTPELVDKLIVDSFDNRFSQISIAPVDNGEPPKIVESDVADKFLAVGILADSNPPKQKGDPEVISNLGSDETAVESFATFISKQTDHEVSIQEPDESLDEGMSP